MNDSPTDFGGTAKVLSKNPLGIIALFIVLVYGFAALVTATGTSLTSSERLPLIYFLVIFPVLVLGVFAWLVSRHTGKLYSPGDFKNEENFVSVIASLAAASAKIPMDKSTSIEVDYKRIAQVVRDVNPQRFKESDTESNRLLWVDDNPDNNEFERQAFEAIGLDITLALSTQEALKILKRRNFAAIISDMGRREGPREGYTLLDALRQNGDNTPFFIYAGSNTPAHKKETGEHGGQGSTNHPHELFDMVTSALSKRRTLE